MPLDDLKKLAKALHQQIDICKNTKPLNPHGIREEKLKIIVAERETWKQRAVLERRKLTEAQEQLEQQKRSMVTGSINTGLAGAAAAVLVNNKSSYTSNTDRKADPPILSFSNKVNGGTISAQSHHAIISKGALSKNSSI